VLNVMVVASIRGRPFRRSLLLKFEIVIPIFRGNWKKEEEKDIKT